MNNIERLKEIWEHFSSHMSEIILYRHAADITAKNELELIDQKERAFNDAPDPNYFSATLYNMVYKDATSGEPVIYDHKELNFEEQRLRMILHKNKQYQWLLVEAYEEFEDYLEKLYAYCGATDNTFWPLMDYGNITLPELSEKGFDWHFEQLRNKKNKPHSILNHFRRRFPDLINMETTNLLKVNLKLTIFMIELMRHYIVHNKGYVNNKADFIEKVTKSAGIYNNGNVATENLHYINLHFGAGDYENLIALLELRVPSEIPLPIYHNRLNSMVEKLMAYARLLFQYAEVAIVGL